jgi:hypothetical protein
MSSPTAFTHSCARSPVARTSSTVPFDPQRRSDLDVARKARGELHQLGRGAGMEPERVHDREAAARLIAHRDP